MLPLSFRIYGAANLAIYLFVAIAFFPEGLGFGFLALLYAVIFSAPVILLLFAGFTLLQRLKPGYLTCWLLLLPLIAVCALVPPLLIHFYTGNDMPLNNLFLPASAGSAIAGTLLQSFYVHRFFQSLSNGGSSTNDDARNED